MKNFSTRLLLSSAAIAVVCGILIALTAPQHTIFLFTIPWAYGALIAIYFLPAAISLPLFQKPGVGILTATLTGLIVSISPLNNKGAMAFIYVIMIGLLQEVPFAIVRYRIWSYWTLVTGALLSGVIMAVMFHIFFDLGNFPFGLQLTQFLLTGLGPVIVTTIGWFIAHALRRAGISTDNKRGSFVDDQHSHSTIASGDTAGHKENSAPSA